MNVYHYKRANNLSKEPSTADKHLAGGIFLTNQFTQIVIYLKPNWCFFFYYYLILYHFFFLIPEVCSSNLSNFSIVLDFPIFINPRDLSGQKIPSVIDQKPRKALKYPRSGFINEIQTGGRKVQAFFGHIYESDDPPALNNVSKLHRKE